MSEATMQERTEEATPRKREEARAEGRIPRSQELNTAVVLLGIALVLNAMGPALGGMMLSTFQYGILVAGSGPLDGDAAVELMRGMGWRVLAGLSAFLLALTGVTLAISAVQARGVLTSKALEPKWERINPLPNAQRMLGIQPWAELVKSLLKLVIVGVAVYFSLRSAQAEVVALAQQAPFGLLGVVRRHAVGLLMTAGFSFLALAALDYLYQVWQHDRSLRMTKQEVKQEAKQNEGDPLIKQRLRSMGRSFARRQMFQEVPKADVVITNPTHIAVALKYDPAKADAPVVLAMGQRKIAERIKAIAKESGVPTVENRPLARALLGSARVGSPIPVELYLAVAEVLAFVIRQREARRTGHTGGVN
jgi:flagellar biosynthetic protein FlhB